MINQRRANAVFFLKSSSANFGKIKQDIGSLPKTLIVGAAATLADLASLAILVQTFEFSPQQANVPSLIIGSLVQFFGNRYISFHGAREGKIAKQMFGFFIAEMGALALNAILFYALVTWTSLSYAIARPLGTFVVFFGLSYPAWRYIFRSHQK